MSVSGVLFGLLVGLNLGFHAQSTVRAWRHRGRRPAKPAAFPPLSILKPCEGHTPGLEDNLRTFAAPDYPAPREVIGCLPDADDPSIPAFRALERSTPDGVHARTVFSRSEPPALNRKIRHLQAGLREAVHETLVFSDDDVRLEPGQLRELIACLNSAPDVGVAFCAPSVAGESPGARWVRHWLCASPTSLYLLATVSPGGPAPNGGCLAIRRDTLERLGGLEPLRDHIGDDLGLARMLRDHGLRAEMAPRAAVSRMDPMTRREAWGMMHRWMVVLSGYFPGFLWAYPTILCSLPVLGLWAALGAALDRALPSAFYAGGYSLVWAARAATGAALARRVFAQPYPARSALTQPFAETLYLAAWAWALVDRRITWRGRRFRVGRDGTMERLSPESAPVCTLEPRP